MRLERGKNSRFLGGPKLYNYIYMCKLGDNHFKIEKSPVRNDKVIYLYQSGG